MPRNNLDLLSLLQEHGAVVEGHFVMPSGFHSQTYIQTSLLLQHPNLAQKIARAMSDKFAAHADVVMALTPSNSVLAQEVARRARAGHFRVQRRQGRNDFKTQFCY